MGFTSVNDSLRAEETIAHALSLIIIMLSPALSGMVTVQSYSVLSSLRQKIKLINESQPTCFFPTTTTT